MKDEIKAVLEEQYIVTRLKERQLKNIEQRHKIENESSDLRRLLSHDTDKVLSILTAAAEAISLAGETVSGNRDTLAKLEELGQAGRNVLHDDAGFQTVVQNLEVFFRQPKEAEAFVNELDDEARANLLAALTDED